MRLSEMIDKDYEPLIPFFIKNQKMVFEEMEVALIESDIDQLKFLAHRLKGTAENYGFKQLGQYAHDLEGLVESNTNVGMEDLIVNMKMYLDHVEIIYIEI